MRHLRICYFLCLIFPTFLSAQNNAKEAYILFDKIVGKTNSGIFNGVQYFEKFKVKSDKHQFFKHKFFIYGSFIYDGQLYVETSLKYDVHSDELLVKNSEAPDTYITQLEKQHVHQFKLNEHLFKNISFSLKQGKTKIDGFFEVLFDNASFSILKKHQKQLSRTVTDEVSYEFKDRFQYYIRFKSTYHSLKKVNSLVSIFPEYKTQLKSSFTKYADLKKTDSDNYLLSIISDLNKHILITN